MRALLAACAASLLVTGCAVGAFTSNVERLAPQLQVVNSALGSLQGANPRLPVIPGFGLVTLYSAPLEVNVHDTQLGTKRGTGTVIFVQQPFFIAFNVVAYGDASVATIARNFGIETVRHVDYKRLSVLGIYEEFTLIVYGD